MAGSCQVGYESLAWSVKPSQNGNYVLVTFHVAHGREVVCGESRTYRIPVESANAAPSSCRDTRTNHDDSACRKEVRRWLDEATCNC